MTRFKVSKEEFVKTLVQHRADKISYSLPDFITLEGEPEYACPTRKGDHNFTNAHCIACGAPEATGEKRCCGGLGLMGKCGLGTKTGCKGAHCRCMELDCPKMHYADCKEHYIHVEVVAPKSECCMCKRSPYVAKNCGCECECHQPKTTGEKEEAEIQEGMKASLRPSKEEKCCKDGGWAW